jgi:site-specific recombinase XerD
VEAIMNEQATLVVQSDDVNLGEATQWAEAFLAGFKSTQTRKAYRRDLDCWFAFCTTHHLHPFRGVRRTHLELYLRELEIQDLPLAPGTLYRRVATLSSWFRWLEDEDVTVGNPAARIRRPQRHARPQPWLNRNELTDLLAAGEDEGGDRITRKLTHHTIAQMIGSSRETVSRTMRNLVERGIIQVTRRDITLKDRRSLMLAARRA